MEICSHTSFITGDILLGMGPFRMLYSFSCYAFTIKNCAGNGCPQQICLDLHGSAVGLLMF